MRMLRALFVFSLLAAGAEASSVVQMDVAALTRAASDVVRVRVSSTECAWTDQHRRLVTLVQVEVLERFKGQATGTLRVVQPGGELDGIGQRVFGVAKLAVGEEVVLFLEQKGPWRGIVGLAQGAYRVERAPGASVARAVPADLHGLTLVPPRGGTLELRHPVSLEALRDEVRREVEHE
jgi:hypothetical protein